MSEQDIEAILSAVEKLPITRTFTFATVGEPAARSVRYCEITIEQRDTLVAEVRRLSSRLDSEAHGHRVMAGKAHERLNRIADLEIMNERLRSIAAEGLRTGGLEEALAEIAREAAE